MHIHRAQIVVSCSQFDETFAALTEQLGFRVDVIFPADAPTTAVVSGFGVALRLVSAIRPAAPVVLRLLSDHQPPAISTADLSIEWVCNVAPAEIPAGRQQFIVTRMPVADAWVTGRAGMQYRDLIPGRYGGRFIASHIRIPAGGPVPDYVHFHNIRFQMIFCKTGWVRVVYEDQGAPFVLNAGDCVLQPPAIRHRVLEASAGLEVIELGCPAIHETHADHEMTLPTSQVRRLREFSGQRFVRHRAADAVWLPWAWMGRKTAGFVASDTGISAATAGLAGARVVRAGTNAETPNAAHDGELLFLFLLSGTLHLHSATLPNQTLHGGDSVTIPAGAEVSLQAIDPVEFLEVTLPAAS